MPKILNVMSTYGRVQGERNKDDTLRTFARDEEVAEILVHMRRRVCSDQHFSVDVN